MAGFVLKKSHAAEYKSLNFAGKRELLHNVVCALHREDPSRTYAQALTLGAGKLGITVTSMYRSGKAIDLPTVYLKLSNPVAVAKIEEDVVKHSPSNNAKDVAFIEVISSVKELSWLLIKASTSLVQTNVKMIDYYTQKINNKFATVENVYTMSKDDAAEVESWQKKLQFYSNNIRDMLRPGNIAGYLKMIGIEQAVANGMEEIDKSAFTIESLQKLFTEVMGQKAITGDKIVIEDVFNQYDDDLPDIKGTR